MHSRLLICASLSFFRFFIFFFFNDTATTEIYTLSLHDALPIYVKGAVLGKMIVTTAGLEVIQAEGRRFQKIFDGTAPGDRKSTRLNSSHSQISYAVFCLKKKKQETSSSRPFL